MTPSCRRDCLNDLLNLSRRSRLTGSINEKQCPTSPAIFGSEGENRGRSNRRKGEKAQGLHGIQAPERFRYLR